jgi:LacI family transcriptional regulator
MKRIGVMMQLDHAFKRHVSIYSGIRDYATQHPDWRIVVDEWADRSLPARAGQPVPYDGIIGRITKLGGERARRLGVPAVNVWFSSPATGLPGVFLDYAASGRLVADHLLGRGFRYLAAILQANDRSTPLMATAMEAAARQSGFDGWLGAKVIDEPDTHSQWRRSIQTISQWMDSWKLPLGLLVRGPGFARAVIELAAERGWHVPQQIAIVCPNNDEFQCEHPEPGLTAVEMPDERCGYEAATMLDALIEGRRQGLDPFANPQTVIMLPVGIVSRHSTDFFAVPDPLVAKTLRYIAAHLHKPLRVSQVARELGIARRTLDAWFEQSLGVTVAAEIARLRIERVKRELTSGTDSIESIARRCGFGGVRTLSDQFRRFVGMPPSEFRALGMIAGTGGGKAGPRRPE